MLDGGVRDAWPLDASIVFLNHGSFGACPKAVLEHQQSLRMQLEREPVRFFVRELEPLWDAARSALASFVGCHAQDLVSVPNATTGVNAVLQSLELQAGDELLLADQAYPACRNAVHATCERFGTHARIVAIPFPPPEQDAMCEAFLAQVTDRTRLALIDHIASPTGAILPVEHLVPALQNRGVRVLVDGAHAPGMIPLNLTAIGADYYVGNCHKWMCAPKGAAFLHVAAEHQAHVRPVVVSLGYRMPRAKRSAFLTEFGWTGTQDPTAFLTVPFAIDYMASLHPGGWAGMRARNHQVLAEALPIVAASLGVDAWIDDGWYGSMASLPLPDRDGDEPRPGVLDGWQDALFEKHAIEVPVVTWPRHPKRLIRLSAHLYNELDDFRALAHALGSCFSNGRAPVPGAGA